MLKLRRACINKESEEIAANWFFLFKKMKIHIRLAMSGYYWIEKMIVSERKWFTLVLFIFKYIYVYI